MKPDPNFKWQVTAIVLFQFFSLFLISKIESYLGLFLCAYLLTGVLNHSLMLAVHEIAHCQAFGQSSVAKNRLFGMWANLPIGISYFHKFFFFNMNSIFQHKLLNFSIYHHNRCSYECII